MADWLNKAVFYEIYPSSFQDSNGDGYGDFQGIINRLDYIKDIGFNAIWLNPCFKSPFMDGGYDISDFFDVSERFGKMEDLERLLKMAHQKGIRIILDLVAGHASEEHPLFLKSAEAVSNEYSDLFVWNNSPWDKPQGWWQFISGRHDRHGNYLVNFFSCQPAFNYGWNKIEFPEWQKSYEDPICLKNREYLKSIIRFYLNKGFDGFRVDMADSLVKNDDDKIATISLWQEIRQEIFDREFPEAILVSEWSDHEKAIRAGFHVDFYLDHFKNGYNRLYRYIQNNINYSFINGTGDITSFLDDYLPRLTVSQKHHGYVGFISGNHDSYRIANNYSQEQLKLAYGLLLTLPGVPFIYNGDEIGMVAIHDLPSKEGGFQRTGQRTPMQWDNSKNMGFSTADKEKLYLPLNYQVPVTVEEQLKNDDSLLLTIKRLISIRKENDDFTSYDFQVLYAMKNAYPFIFARGNFIVMVNSANKEVCLPLLLEGEKIYQIGREVEVTNNIVKMAPWSFAIYKRR